jgi:hypothetical protein
LEFEIEHAVASADDAGEFEVEQFYVDHQFADWGSVKAGLFLMPFGLLRTSRTHELLRGTAQLCQTLIIPSTWREGGGVYTEPLGRLTWDLGLTTA